MNLEFKIKRSWLHSFFLLATFAALAGLVGTRDESIGFDSLIYAAIYDEVQNCGCLPSNIEPIFGFLTWISSKFGSSRDLYFSVVSLLQFVLTFFWARLLSKYFFQDERLKNAFLIYVLSGLLASPFFLSGQVNILRQGLSAPLLISAAVYFMTSRKWLGVICAVVAAGFHYSTILYLPFLLIILLKRKIIYLVLVISAISYISGASEACVVFLSNTFGLGVYELIFNYGIDAEYIRGVRLDFLVFSIVPLIISFVFNKIFFNTEPDPRFFELEKIYIALLIPFLIFGWGSFSDRYAFFSWLLIPAFAALMLVKIRGASGVVIKGILFSSGYFAFAFSIS